MMETTTYENMAKYKLQVLAMACLGERELTPFLMQASRQELIDLIEAHPAKTMDSQVLEKLTNDLNFLTDSIDEQRRRLTATEEAIEALKAAPKSKEITIVLKQADEVVSTTTLPGQHHAFEKLLTMAKARVNSFLVGPAGSGKSTAAKNVASALNLPFYFNGAIDSEYKLTGFIDAQGRIISKPFREAFINGGVYLFDEVDGSMPQAVLPFNAALANNRMDFPDGCFDAHPNFICIAAGNTFFGPDSHYVGRFKQDGAFLDRFAVLEWTYDYNLERSMALSVGYEPTISEQWHTCILALRDLALSKGIQIIASPRATVNGIRLMKEGFTWDEAVQVCLRKSMKTADWEKLADAVRKPGAKQAPAAAPVLPSPPPTNESWQKLYTEGSYNQALTTFLAETDAKNIKLNNKGVEMIRKIFSERPQLNNFTLSRIDGVLRSPKCLHRSVTLNGLV